MKKKGVGKKSTEEAEALNDRVAVLAGGGMARMEIAAAVGRSKRRVQQILTDEITPARRELMERARARVQEQALEIMERHLATMDASFKGGNLGHQAQALRVLGETAACGGYNRVPPVAAVAPSVTINLQDAATVASFVQALRMLNEPKTIEVKAEPENAG